MKIYFAGSIRGGRDEEDNYMELIHHLTTFGEVLTEHIGNKGIDKSELNNTDQYIYERDINWLKKSDVMVADVTVPSLGVGYEISFAEQLNIPILCLFNPKNKKSLSAMLSGNKKIINNEYQSINDAKLVLDNFFANL
jgi:2'-deoxynucleoside 5'-phosphate N-hydrolase